MNTPPQTIYIGGDILEGDTEEGSGSGIKTKIAPPMSESAYVEQRISGILKDLEGQASTNVGLSELSQTARNLGATEAQIAEAIRKGEIWRVIPDKSSDEYIRKEVDRLRNIENSSQVVYVPEGIERFIHNTGEDSAFKIATEGLLCSPGGIKTTAVRLDTADIEKNYESLARRHRSGEDDHVVVIDFPSLPEEIQEAVTAREKLSGISMNVDTLLVRDIEVVDDSGQEETLTGIPPKFVKGVFLAKEGTWIENPNFNPVIDEEDKKAIIGSLYEDSFILEQ